MECLICISINKNMANIKILSNLCLFFRFYLVLLKLIYYFQPSFFSVANMHVIKTILYDFSFLKYDIFVNVMHLVEQPVTADRSWLYKDYRGVHTLSFDLNLGVFKEFLRVVLSRWNDNKINFLPNYDWGA